MCRYEWILDQRGVSYYGRDERSGLHATIYLIGNPVALYTVIAGMLLALVGAPRIVS